MPATERLYYQDSHLIEFEALVTDKTERVSGWTAITLDRTAFYPTGGGQPSDTGTLNGSRVVECIDDESGVLHVMQGTAPEVGATVRGRVDWARRLDHMQQHTGQHILSQAFVTLFNAPTRSFRVLEESCEIDVDLPEPSAKVIERAVELANNVIWEDRTITIRNVSAQEAAELRLRKEPARDGELRLIEIAGFDLTPCGGTHAYRTGEVGMIAVRTWERAKGLTRIEWVAGVRALADYRRANQTSREVASLFSSGRDDAATLAARMVEENKELHRRVRALEEIAARVEADEILRDYDASHRIGMVDETAISNDMGSVPPAVAGGSATTSEMKSVPPAIAGGSATTSEMKSVPPAIAGGSDSSRELSAQRDTQHPTPSLVRGSSQTVREGVAREFRVITRVFDNRDAGSLKHLAQALIAHPRIIALLASRDGDTARLVFARSADAAGDMNMLMRDACVMLEGRGGGKPDMAQGGGKKVERVAEVIDEAAKTIQKIH